MPNQATRLREVSQKELDAMLADIARDAGPQPIRNFRPRPEEQRINAAPQFYTSKLPDAENKVRALTPEECQQLFGVSQSVKMNFVPQMLMALAFQEASKLVNYCRDNRIGEMKKHTRVIKGAVEEYPQRLRKAYGDDAFRSYVHFQQMYFDECAGNIWMMEMYADTLCQNQMRQERHKPIANYALVVAMLITYCQKYDREMDKVIASKLGQPVSQRPDFYQSAVLMMCQSIANDLGFKITPDDTMATWIQVLSNKAARLADKILAEEGKI